MSSFLRADTAPDDVIASVERQIAGAQAHAQRARDLQDALTAVRGTAASSRGHVQATVDVSGRLTDVVLSACTSDLPPAQLGRLIVETSRAAHRSAGAKALEIAAEVFGRTSGVVERLRSELDEISPSRRTGRGLS